MTEFELYNAELGAHENRMFSVAEITDKFYKKYPQFKSGEPIKTDEILRYEYFLKIRKEADRKIDMFFQFCLSDNNKGKSMDLLIKQFELALILKDR